MQIILFNILSFFLIFYICLYLHEFGHLLAFIVQREKIVAFYVFPLLVDISKGKIKFKWDFFCLGKVTPKIPALNEKNMNIFRKKMQRSILAGALVNLGLLVTSALFLVIVDSKFLWILNIVNLIMTIQNTKDNKYVLGDYIAYYKIKVDNAVFIRIIYTWYLQDAKRILENEKIFVKYKVI